jgi:hypothetical protein
MSKIDKDIKNAINMTIVHREKNTTHNTIELYSLINDIMDNREIITIINKIIKKYIRRKINTTLQKYLFMTKMIINEIKFINNITNKIVKEKNYEIFDDDIKYIIYCVLVSVIIKTRHLGDGISNVDDVNEVFECIWETYSLMPIDLKKVKRQYFLIKLFLKCFHK